MRFLLLNQTFYPDVASTAQHLSDVAVRLAERGHEVTVLTSRRAYDDPKTVFPSRETWRGVRIIRIGSTSFGKGAKWRRAADFASFLLFCSLRLAFLPRFDVVLALTSPPLISVLGAVFAKLHRSRFVYWVMDFNPDEAIAAGWLRADSVAAKLLGRLSRFSLRRASQVIALDHFMRDRIVAKGINGNKVSVLPPWSHDDEVKFDPAGRDAFRRAHGLEGKFVVMYSGNHSPCHPLDTLLAAADRLKNNRDILFCFVGGGSEWRKIQSSIRDLPSSNLRCLPYQPLKDLSASLSAADLQVVVMGDAFVGLIHPCKVYNVMAVSAPFLYIGPALSHISEIANCANGEFCSFSARHGDLENVVQQIQRARAESNTNSRQSLPLLHSFSKETVLPKLIAELEST